MVNLLANSERAAPVLLHSFQREASTSASFSYQNILTFEFPPEPQKTRPCNFCASSVVVVTGIIVSNDPVNRWDLLGLNVVPTIPLPTSPTNIPTSGSSGGVFPNAANGYSAAASAGHHMDFFGDAGGYSGGSSSTAGTLSSGENSSKGGENNNEPVAGGIKPDEEKNIPNLCLLLIH